MRSSGIYPSHHRIERTTKFILTISKLEENWGPRSLLYRTFRCTGDRHISLGKKQEQPRISPKSLTATLVLPFPTYLFYNLHPPHLVFDTMIWNVSDLKPIPTIRGICYMPSAHITTFRARSGNFEPPAPPKICTITFRSLEDDGQVSTPRG